MVFCQLRDDGGGFGHDDRRRSDEPKGARSFPLLPIYGTRGRASKTSADFVGVRARARVRVSVTYLALYWLPVREKKQRTHKSSESLDKEMRL